MTNNISWQGSMVTKQERAKITGNQGLVLWFTGLSGSGKSTIATTLEKELITKGILAYCVDGDEMRKTISKDLGFSIKDRQEHIKRVVSLVKILKDIGIVVLVSVISPLQIMRDEAKKEIGEADFFEIYVKASIESCKKRDPKGLYKKFDEGKIEAMTGITSVYEPPIKPSIVLETETNDVIYCVEKVNEFLQNRLTIYK